MNTEKLDNESANLEALEALHYCTADFVPVSEVIQSACPNGLASNAVHSRFIGRLQIAQKLGYIESVQRGQTKLIRLSEAGFAVREQLRYRGRS